jgi:hypothetical protein
MLLDALIELATELIRTLLIEEVSERVRRLRPQPRVRGLAGVRRHVHQATRRRLLNRLSTELGSKSASSQNFPSLSKFKKLLQ